MVYILTAFSYNKLILFIKPYFIFICLVFFSLHSTLAAKFVRLGFHDCVGGCDGCVNMDNADNAGLDTPIDALADIVTTYESDSGLSRADIWALAALTGTNHGLERDGGSSTFFEMSYYGRENCGDDETGGTDHELPAPDLDTQDVLDFFADNFDFSDQETCAIMGAHTLGTLSQENSGFDGDGWVRSNIFLNNMYYQGIVGNGTTSDEWFEGPGWHIVEIDNSDLSSIPNRFQWNSGRAEDDDGDAKTKALKDEDKTGDGRGLLRAFFGVNDDCNCTDADDSTTSDSTTGDDSNTATDDEEDFVRLMLNADIALVRTFGDNLSEDGDVSCDFRGRDACPAADTLEQMAAYRMDNDLWLTDFKAAWEKMLIQGCTGCTSV